MSNATRGNGSGLERLLQYKETPLLLLNSVEVLIIDGGPSTQYDSRTFRGLEAMDIH